MGLVQIRSHCQRSSGTQQHASGGCRMAFLNDYAYFIGVALIVVLLLLFYVAFKTGYSYERFMEHWRTTGDGAPAGIVQFIGILSFIALLVFLANSAHASEWFKYTEIYAGVDHTFKPSPQCERNDVDEHLTSNGGVRQHLYSFTPNVSLLGNYTHHSCAVGVDAAGYDAAGIQLNWRFER